MILILPKSNQICPNLFTFVHISTQFCPKFHSILLKSNQVYPTIFLLGDATSSNGTS